MVLPHCSFEDGNMLEITTPPPPLVSLAAVFSIVTQRSFGGEERCVTRQRTAARETTPPPHPSHKRERNIKRKGKTKEYQADFSFAILGFKTKKFYQMNFFLFFFYFSKLYFTCFDHYCSKKTTEKIFLLSIPHSCSTDCFFTIPTFYRKVLKPTTQCLDDMKGEGRKCPRNKMYIDDIRLLFKFQNSNHLIILLFFIYKTRLYI